MTWVTIAQIFSERTVKTATVVLSLLNRMIILLDALHLKVYHFVTPPM